MTDDDGHIEAGENARRSAVSPWLEDLRDSLMFLTRLPVPARDDGGHRALAQAVRGFPLAGALVGAIAGLALLGAQGAGLPVPVAATIAVLAGIIATGALHEDGLADVADGFGAGGGTDRKLEIMRDSRIGTYGVLALVFAIGLKVLAVSGIAAAAVSLWQAPAVLVASAALSRSYIAVLMAALPAARRDGRSAEAGRPRDSDLRQANVVGGILSAVLLWLSHGWWGVIGALAASGVAYYLLKRMAMRHIGGQTGDVLGAMQQVTEIAVLLALVATSR